MTDPANNSSSKTRQRRTRSIRELHWSSVDPALIAHFVGAVTDEGCAALFARTRDGGTLVAQVLNGDIVDKEYLTDPLEAPTVLNWMLDDLKAPQYDTGPVQHD